MSLALRGAVAPSSAGLALALGSMIACSGGEGPGTETFYTTTNTTSSAGPQPTTVEPATMTETTGTTEGTTGSSSDPGSSSSSDPSSSSGPGTETGSTTTTSGPGTTEGAAPTVVMTDPDDAAVGVAPSPAISVTFSEEMNLGTIVTNTEDTSCTGSVQVSSDGFATCVQMQAEPSSDDQITFTVQPADPLASATTYAIRVTSDAQNGGGVNLAADWESPQGFTVRYYHVIEIDGTNDFVASDEEFAASTPGFNGYVAWDTAFLYVAMSGPDFENNAVDTDFKFLLVYLGGDGGTTTGVQYNTQAPMLPFSAAYHVRHKLDDSFTSGMEWSGNTWTEAGWNWAGDVNHGAGYLELRIPLADIGDPETLDLHLSVINEKALAEATFAAVPDGSITDGYDPDYDEYFTFDLLGSTLPADHVPQP